jgi:mono/diheme cytochrome c family protein
MWFAVIAAVVVVLGVRSEIAAAQSKPKAAAAQTSTIYKDVYNGWKWWHVYCYRCHGVNAMGSDLAPSLIQNRVDPKWFLKKARAGVRDTAMMSWTKLLDDAQIMQIYTYVSARTDGILPPGRPDEVGPNKGPWVPPPGWSAK